MNRQEYKDKFKDELANMLTIMHAKNNDYATEGDPFANFRLVENMGVASTEQGILIRMLDKMSRISNLLNPNVERKVLDESIMDTLSDLANYSVILNVYLQSKK